MSQSIGSRGARFFGWALISTISVSLMACSGRELASGAAGVIVGIGIGKNKDNNRNGYRNSDRCRNGTYCRNSEADLSLSANTSMFSGAAEFAQRNEVSPDVAIRLQDILYRVRGGDSSFVQELGFSAVSLIAFTQGVVEISQSQLVAISEHLGTSVTETESLLAKVAARMQIQASDQGSELWQFCQSSGTWRTPENVFCKNTSWEGCSVNTGATSCIAL